MDLKSIPMFSALRASMHWLDGRQKVLADNVANATMPGYKARDLEDLDFSAALSAVEKRADGHNQHAFHGSSSSFSGRGGGMTSIGVVESSGSEISADGNSVVLEEQMMKVTETRVQYQAAVGLYKKGLGLIRLAIK
jgi:flagellar basal-body rod protein FlgB